MYGLLLTPLHLTLARSEDQVKIANATISQTVTDGKKHYNWHHLWSRARRAFDGHIYIWPWPSLNIKSRPFTYWLWISRKLWQTGRALLSPTRSNRCNAFIRSAHIHVRHCTTFSTSDISTAIIAWTVTDRANGAVAVDIASNGCHRTFRLNSLTFELIAILFFKEFVIQHKINKRRNDQPRLARPVVEVLLFKLPPTGKTDRSVLRMVLDDWIPSVIR